MTDNETGYITSNNGNSIFSTRKKQFFTNVLKAEYVLNTKMSFDFKFEHHWEQVRNYSFHTFRPLRLFARQRLCWRKQRQF